MTQTERLREYLTYCSSITPLEAWEYLGIYRLSARIHDLKKQGYNITSEIVTIHNRFGEEISIAKYRLKPTDKHSSSSADANDSQKGDEG